MADGPSCATRTGGPGATQLREHLGRVLVVVDDQNAAAGRGGRTPRPPAARRARPLAVWAELNGTRSTNSLPFPGPSLARLDVAAVQLDQAAHDREAEAEAALRPVEGLALLHEQVEHIGSISAEMPMPVSRTRERDVRRLAPGRRPRSGRPDRCTSPRWSAGSRRPARAASDRRRRRRPAAGTSATSSLVALLEAAGSPSRPPWRRCRRSRRARVRSSILPRVIRETSSRSSTSRTRCLTWRSMIVRSCSTPVRRAGASAAARSTIGESGLRSSWPSIARNSSFARLARDASTASASSRRPASCSSSCVVTRATSSRAENGLTR